MRKLIIYGSALGVLLSAAPPAVQAGSTGRRNTAIAATAVAAGAWSNGTGKKGRRNTALVATAGAAYAWKRYADKKRDERHRPKVRVTRVAHRTHTTRVVERTPAARVSHPAAVVVASARPAPRPACPCGQGCGIKEYEHKPSGETKIKYLCGAEWERTASGETKFKR
jgi:hypothetical protein